MYVIMQINGKNEEGLGRGRKKDDRNLEPRVSPALCQRLVADKEPEKLWARDWDDRGGFIVF